MKLLVVVETLKGSCMAWSMARTFTAPEPMPETPERTPAVNIRLKPAGHVGDVIGLHALRRGEGAVEAEQGSDVDRVAGSAQIGA